MIPFPLLAAWYVTDEAREWASVIADTLTLCGLARKQAADYAQISEQKLSDWLACRRPIHTDKLRRIPGFQAALLTVLAAREEHVTYPRESVKVILVVNESGKRPMLRMALPASAQEDVA